MQHLRHQCFTWTLAVVVVLSRPAILSAQTGTADLAGKVLDQQGGALPGVLVVARNQDSGVFRQSRLESVNCSFFQIGTRFFNSSMI